MAFPQSIGDVGRSDGAEERARRPCLHVEPKLDRAQPLGELLRVLERLGLVLRALVLRLAQLCDARRRRLLRELSRQEEVACVAARDVDDLAAQADLLDVREEDDFHDATYLESDTYGSNAISRARFTATATWR